MPHCLLSKLQSSRRTATSVPLLVSLWLFGHVDGSSLVFCLRLCCWLPETTDSRQFSIVSPIFTAFSLQSGVSSDTTVVAAPRAERTVAIADLGLDVSSDSDSGGERPAKREKFSKEKRTPRHTSRSAKQSTHRRSPSKASRARRPRTSNKVKRPRSCDRCANRTHGRHHASCPNVGQFFTYVLCPRCQCLSTLASQWRYHAHQCYKHWPRDQTPPTTDWEDLVKKSDEPVSQHSCLQCRWWRSPHVLLTDIHYVLCSAFPDPTPALPPYECLVNINKDITLTRDVAEMLDLAFQRKPELKISITVGYLYKHTVVRMLQIPRGDNSPPGRPVTADLPSGPIIAYAFARCCL